MKGKLIGWSIVAAIVCVVMFVPPVRDEFMGLFNKAKDAHNERVKQSQDDANEADALRKANAKRRRGHDSATGAKVFYEAGQDVYHASTDCEDWAGRKRAARPLAEALDSSMKPCSKCDPPTK